MTVRAIGGLFAFNLALFGAGTVVLWGLGAVRFWTSVVRLAGVAYLLGLAAFMTVLTLELVVGVPVDMATNLLSLAAIATGGLLFGLRNRRPRPCLRPSAWRFPRISLFAAIVAAGIAAYFEALFRAARLTSVLGEWDGWWVWVPKAKVIYFFGRLEPELLAFFPAPSASYPPGLPAVHAAAFHAIGSADDITLHLQYWFYAAGFVGALAGLLGSRVRQNIFVPLLLLALLAPSLVGRLTWTYADLPLGYLVAVAALLLFLWIEERQSWHLVVGIVLLSGAVLTKREGALFAACVLLAAFSASWGERRFAWPRLALAALAGVALVLPWRIWFTAQGLPSDAPSTGFLGAFTDFERAWPSVELVASTLFEQKFWLLVPILFVAATVLAVMARGWTIAVFGIVFVASASAAATWTIWAEPGIPITQDDARNPIVRMTGTTILVLVALLPLLLEHAWAHSGERMFGTRLPRPGPDALVFRSYAAWAIVLLAAFAYPGSMLVGYSGQTLPGDTPRFPTSSDCVSAPVDRGAVRVVVGYADSYRDANALRTRAVSAGLRNTEILQDGCGRLRVFVDDLPSLAASGPLLAAARSADLHPTVEADTDD